MALKPIRVKAFPPPNKVFEYDGVIVNKNTGAPIAGGLTGVSAQASLGGAAYSSTGVTFAEDGVTGFFTITVAAAQMAAVYGILRVTVTNTNAEDWFLDFRTDYRREKAYGIPQNLKDAQNGDYDDMTGLLCPASALKTVDGNRVPDFWEGRIDD